MVARKKNPQFRTYRVLKTDIPGGASGTGNRFERVCVESLFHATIVREEFDSKLVEVNDVLACDCKQIPVFPELLRAIRARC
ncbi:hypothetical protein IT087_02695 [Candidatus Uhrbacteria bacterium]|nr:hypothetical protein [Candidatus Uhrbacteria bacterium]